MTIKSIYERGVDMEQCQETAGLYSKKRLAWKKRRFSVMANHTRANTRKVLGVAMFYDTDDHKYTYGKVDQCMDNELFNATKKW